MLSRVRQMLKNKCVTVNCKASDCRPYFIHFFLRTQHIIKGCDSQALASLAMVIYSATALCCQQFAFTCTTEASCTKGQQYVHFNSPSYASCQSHQKNETGSQAQKQSGTAKLLFVNKSPNVLQQEGRIQKGFLPFNCTHLKF